MSIVIELEADGSNFDVLGTDQETERSATVSSIIQLMYRTNEGLIQLKKPYVANQPTPGTPEDHDSTSQVTPAAGVTVHVSYGQTNITGDGKQIGVLLGADSTSGLYRVLL